MAFFISFFFGDMRGEWAGGYVVVDPARRAGGWGGGGGPLPRFALAGSRAVVGVCLLDRGVKSTYIPRLSEGHTVLYGKMMLTVYAAVRGRWKPVCPSGVGCWKGRKSTGK